MNSVIFDTDNLIYNRYDIIHENDYDTLTCEFCSEEYCINIHKENGISEVNLWGKSLPDEVLSKLIQNIFCDVLIYAILVTRFRNQVQNYLEKTNDVRVPLPDTFDELMSRAEKRDRATIRRKLRWLDERIGALQIDVYAKDEIPDSIVESYFKWKKESHGTEYGLTPAEYLDKYYVTDGMRMKAGDTDVAVAFFCQVEDIVFFENFSYNPDLKEYSPGLLMYVKLMEELIKRKCRYLYLGGGGYIYKKRFGAEHNVAYSGMIYRKEIVDGLNYFLASQAIRTVAFYGYGVCGRSFFQLSKNLNINVAYGIDRSANDEESTEIKLYLPEDDLPNADAGLITLNNKNAEVEEYMHSHFGKVYYWNDVLEEIISEYRKSVNAKS